MRKSYKRSEYGPTWSRLSSWADDEVDHVNEGFDLSFDVTRKPPTSDLLDQSAEGHCVLAKFVNLLRCGSALAS